MNLHLTKEMRERLTAILVDEGCCCEEQHDFPDDATSLNCLASSTLYDLEIVEQKLARAINYGIARDDELTKLRAEFVKVANKVGSDD
jgi:hypothetical protein